MPLACQWEGLTLPLIVRTGCDYSGGAAVQGLTIWNRVPFSGALVPAEFGLRVYHLWMWFGGALVWAELGHPVFWFWGLVGGAVVQAKISHCLFPAWGHFCELQSGAKMVAIYVGLGVAWERLSCKLGLAFASTRLWAA